MSRRRHWESVYAAKSPEAVSWFRPHLERSLAFLSAAKLGRDAAIIDVGGGASTLVDDLLARGFFNVTVLDVSEAALECARRRLGDFAAKVTWIAADVTEAKLPERAYDFWHDRAVFHFLTDESARQQYVKKVWRSLKPGGQILVATFGPDGPEKCSGLDVVRYTEQSLHAQFGADFERLSSEREVHITPWGSEQPFVYCHCRISG